MTQAKTARLDGAALREAALAYVTRYGGTEAALARALDRRIRRWADALASVEGCDRTTIAGQAAGLREAAAKVVADLVAMGAVNDQAFAESRARRLRRAGRSRRAVLAHLAARGVAGETAGEAVPEDTATEFAAALAFARRRRVGPFAVTGPDAEADAEAETRILMAFGRAGFSGSIARRALACERE
ncbi:MAG TPA: RecX family transcriptional regulator, partial [Acidisoma sp.]|uniref:RecX family transcriptional regulator n=1 Tax=Acidisoma sp. TaxID=1872115 RepID=UPI002C57B9F6